MATSFYDTQQATPVLAARPAAGLFNARAQPIIKPLDALKGPVREYVENGARRLSELPFTVPALTREQLTQEHACLMREAKTIARRLRAISHELATLPCPLITTKS